MRGQRGMKRSQGAGQTCVHLPMGAGRCHGVFTRWMVMWALCLPAACDPVPEECHAHDRAWADGVPEAGNATAMTTGERRRVSVVAARPRNPAGIMVAAGESYSVRVVE